MIACQIENATVVLRDDAYAVVDMAAHYREIERATGLDMSRAITFIERIPLFLRGEAHKNARRRLAGLLSAARPQMVAKREPHLARLQQRLGDPDGTFDLVADVLVPMYADMSTAFLPEADHLGTEIVEFTRLFDPVTGLARRKRMNDAIGRVVAASPAPAGDTLDALALTVLGHDPFIASLGLTVAGVIGGEEPLRRLCDMNWPTEIAETGLPATERDALRDTTLGTTPIAAGTRVRVDLDALGPDSYFGIGAHLCIGRALSRESWTALASVFAGSTSKASLERVTIREPDRIFRYPETIRITLHG